MAAVVSTVERTYTQRFRAGAAPDGGEDWALLCHPNGLAVLCLAPRHALARAGEGAAVAASVSYDVGPNGEDARDLQATRKGGKDAAPVLPGTPLLRVGTEGGGDVTLALPVRGKVMELNERLGDSPGLLAADPLGAGFVAVLWPRAKELEELLTPEAYGALRGADALPFAWTTPESR